MKFRRLNESNYKPKIQYEEELTNYIYNKYLDSALDNIALSAAADLYWYDVDWAAEDVTYYSQEVLEYLQKAARACAEDLLYNYIDDFGTDEEEYDESLNEDLNSYTAIRLNNILKGINDGYNLHNIQLFMTPKGNINIRTKDNKDIVTIDGKSFSEDEIDDLRANGYFDLYNKEFLGEDANDFYKEEPSEDFDASEFIGRPLKDFLKTIDHRTKINISSENGYDDYGGKGDISGLSGLAHDTSWYLADKKITDIKIPKDKRFYSYSIFIEGLDDKKNLKEEFKIGQKVLYDGKETIIKDIENDPRYGIDLLIKNPNWDGQDERFAYIWVGNNVEKLN